MKALPLLLAAALLCAACGPELEELEPPPHRQLFTKQMGGLERGCPERADDGGTPDCARAAQP